MAFSLMASKNVVLQHPAGLLSPTTVRHRLLTPHGHLSKPQTISFRSTPKLPLPNLKRRATVIASSYSSTVVQNPSSADKSQDRHPPQSLLTGSTRTVTTLLAVALAASKFLAHKVVNLALQLKGFHGLGQPLIYTAGPAFFAAIRDTSTGTLNTPFTVVAAGMSKWLDIYSGVLMVRVLLSWFPNIPWDRQPLSAIRDLCDPYLNLFRNIIPPIFDTLDISPLLAFAVLGTLGSILKSSKGGF